MIEPQAQQATQTAARRGRPRKQQAGAASGSQSTQTTAGNARHKRTLTLGDKVKAMESRNSRLIRLADQIKQTVRGG